MKKKLVLAYSGGLDTTVILHWLAQRGWDVKALLLDIGQQVDDLEVIGERAKQGGASSYHVINARDELLHDYFLPCMHAGARYEGRYLMGTSIARPLIAKHHIEFAHKVGATAVAHGATGKGNDQVRFELGYHALDPSIQIVPVWRDPEFIAQFPDGRKSLLAYAERYALPVKQTASKPWSTDDNLLHISYEAGVLEDPWRAPPQGIFERMIHPTHAPEQVTRFALHFEKGVPTRVHAVGEGDAPEIGECLAEGLSSVFAWTEKAARQAGVGALGLVESRYVGMKSRGEYHAPAQTVLMSAHADLESICLPGSFILEKLRRMPDFAQQVYAGYWFDPACSAHREFVKASQTRVSGDVRVGLYKGNIMIEGRRSPLSLYDAGIASMDESSQEAYDPTHATGFIRLHALPLRRLAHKQEIQ